MTGNSLNMQWPLTSQSLFPTLTAGLSRGGEIPSPEKRNFGGPEAINFTLVYDSTFGVKGWLASAVEISQDILFHVSGYTVLGKMPSMPT
jgi:hypothetical protein